MANTFDAMNRWLAKRLSMPTTLKSKGISEQIPARVRANAFFSAQVSNDRVLSKIREVSDLVSTGKIGVSEARGMLKEWLGGGNDGPLENIKSTARLNLILTQNAKMAQAVGRHQVAHDPAVMERWPYQRYITGPNPRPEHAALDGRIYHKSDPIWRKITPPWDFNCNCDIEDVDEEEARAAGFDAIPVDSGEETEVEPAASGYAFDPADAFAIPTDLSGVADPAIRSLIAAMIKKMTEEL